MHKVFIILFFFGLSTTICSAQSDLDKGIEHYKLRAENRKELKVDSIHINQAIFYLHKALASNTHNEKAYHYLLLSYYYKGAFVVKTKAEQKRNYYLGKKLGEEATQLYPKNSALLLWYIANYSKYGEANGIVASAKNGLADKIKTEAEKLLELDPKFNDGSAYKLLGVIHYKVPYIPLFITWPSKEKAEEYLKKALSVNPKSISNIYYYAEFLTEVKREAEAKVLLNKIVNAIPRSNAIVEDLYDISMAKKLLNKISK